MTKTRFIGALTVLILMAACQFPVGPVNSGRTGVKLTLTLTQPSLTSGSRLLLPNATDVTLTVVSGGVTVDELTVPRTGDVVTLELSLEPLKTYTLGAKAKDKSGTVLFSGTSTVTLTASAKSTLNLLPVPAPVASLAAADQPPGGTMGSLATLAPNAMATYLLDFGTTGSEFTFTAPPTDVDLYLQLPDGTPLPPLAADRVVKKPASGTSLLATYYNKGTVPSSALTTLGSFTIPFVSLTLAAGPTAALGTGATLDLPVTVVPANATDAALTWASSASTLASVDSTGRVTALLPGTATITGTSTSVGRPAVTVTIDLTLNPTQYQIVSVPAVSVAAVPVPTLALAGDAAQFWALGTDQSVRQFAAGLWETTPSVPSVPTAAAKWLAAAGGTLFAGSPTAVYSFDGTGSWTLVTAPPVGANGLAFAGGLLWSSSSDGFLWSWQGGIWQKGPALPAGFLAVGGGEGLTVLTATQILTFNGSGWEAGPVPPAQAAALTSAYQSILILVVR